MSWWRKWFAKTPQGFNLAGTWVPISDLEFYLGPSGEWIDTEPTDAPKLFRARGWAVHETDPIGETAKLIVARKVPTLLERWPDPWRSNP